MRGLTFFGSTPLPAAGWRRSCADGLGRELALRDRADDAVVVARGRQEHRHRAGHDDAVQDALVAVAVDHHHVARRHRVVPDHLVAGAGAVGDEEAVVGVEDARRVALALRHRAGVVEQLAEFLHALQTSARSMFSPKNWWNIWPTGLFRKATPPLWPGQCQE
jgi:hypothetical protein